MTKPHAVVHPPVYSPKAAQPVQMKLRPSAPPVFCPAPPNTKPVVLRAAANAPARKLAPPVFRAVQARSQTRPVAGPPPVYRPGRPVAPSIQRQQKGTVQCAYFARRALGGVLGGGDLSENPNNKGIFHEHLFFEDGGDPRDLGFFADGLHADLPSNRRLYHKLGGEFGGAFDDQIMRMAVDENAAPGAYNMLGNNCQAWVTRVLASYNRIAARLGMSVKAKTFTPQSMEMTEL